MRRMNAWGFGVLVGNLVACLFAQEPTQSQDDRPIPLSIGSPAGARIYKPGHWAPVGIEVANPTDHPQEVTATAYFSLDPFVQFRRRLYLPPHTRRMATCLVQTPRLDSREVNEAQRLRKTFDLYTVVATEDGKVLPGLTGELTRNSFLVKHLEHISSAMFPNSGPQLESAFPTPYDAAIALRLATGLTRRVAEFARPVFPDSFLELEAIQQITLHNNEAFQDASTVPALRAWVLRGGRLWIMLDRVDPSNVQWLLGDRVAPVVLDRTELTDFALQSTGPGSEIDVQSHECPVEFVRVMVEEADVTHTVDGYPAAFFQNYGLGRILYTTLGPAAWVRPARRYESQPDDPERQAVFLARPALAHLATRLLVPVEQMPWDIEQWRPYLETRIGYRVVRRSTVAMVFATYLVGLSLTVWFGRRFQQKPWHAAGLVLGWILLAAVPLTLRGWWQSSEVPATIAQGQLVLMQPDSREVIVRGAVASFQQRPQIFPVSASSTALFNPDGRGLEGALRQLVFDDTQRWHWENLRVPAGIRLSRVDAAKTLEQPVHLIASLGPQGLEGRVEGLPVLHPEDSLLLMPNGSALALHFQPDGRFWGGPNDVLPEGRFIAGKLLTDEQRRRQSLLELAVAQRTHTLFPREPTLLIWGPPVQLGLSLPEEFKQVGAALYQVRFRWERPPAGQRVVIPSVLLAYSPAAGPTGQGVSTSYDPHRRQWLRMSVPSETWLRVQIPEMLLPFSVERLSLDSFVEAAGRSVDLLLWRWKEKALRTVDSFYSRAGPWRLELTEPEWLEPDEQGGVWLAVRVGPPSQQEGSVPEWQVHYLHVTLEGRVR